MCSVKKQMSRQRLISVMVAKIWSIQGRQNVHPRYKVQKYTTM